jgi:hypothetical protein
MTAADPPHFLSLASIMMSARKLRLIAVIILMKD